MEEPAGVIVDSGRFWVLRFRLMVKRGHCVDEPPALEGQAKRGLFAGPDVSAKDTGVPCDDTGKTVREAKAASEPGLPLNARAISTH
jgi:hypothetical protein